MKKVLKLSSLAIVLMALLTLTACAPKADKAEEKMENAAYVCNSCCNYHYCSNSNVSYTGR